MKKVPCPDCGGRGTFPWADQDIVCATCDGEGKIKVKDVPKQAPADRR